MEEIKKSKLFGIESPKLAFVFGFLVGITVFSLLVFILFSVSLIQERIKNIEIQKETTKTEEQKEKKTVDLKESEPQGIEAKIVGQVGTFYEVDEPICKKNGKPLIFMFSTSWCPHCQWVKPIFENAVKDYLKKGKILAYNWELDTNDNTLSQIKETVVDPEHEAFYKKYNPYGSIPTFVFGCKYYRIGTGYERSNDKIAEEKEFKELIEKLLK